MSSDQAEERNLRFDVEGMVYATLCGAYSGPVGQSNAAQGVSHALLLVLIGLSETLWVLPRMAQKLLQVWGVAGDEHR